MTTSLYIPLFLPQAPLLIPQTQCAHSYELHNQIPTLYSVHNTAILMSILYIHFMVGVASHVARHEPTDLGLSGGIRGCGGRSEVLYYSVSI